MAICDGLSALCFDLINDGLRTGYSATLATERAPIVIDDYFCAIRREQKSILPAEAASCTLRRVSSVP